MEGEVETSTALLNEKFDYIFFTGSTGVGRIVMKGWRRAFNSGNFGAGWEKSGYCASGC